MTEGGSPNRIVMINSFKGGAGKTTAALCRCITEYREKRYRSVYYVDMDVLGTGVDYTLSISHQKGQNYYNDIEETNLKLSKKVQLVQQDEEGNRFYAAVLNPLSRIKQSYEGQDRLRAHPNVEGGIFRNKVMTLINQIMQCGETTLIVLDCAPGISYVEQSILDELYTIEKNKRRNTVVEEIYVTTPDASHIRKTVDNINEYSAYLRQHNRTITVLLNDLFDCEGMARRAEEETKPTFIFRREKILKYVTRALKVHSFNILYKKYSEDLLRGSIILNEAKLSNRLDAYDSWPQKEG
ncbi:MAG: hypothetical protein NC123_07615 [Butyrivibrio sp.]|nr:hypothetical protein [Acetatifactor muris]MCM1559398.1 hypothetical protein [Butyrivibrio sp.]